MNPDWITQQNVQLHLPVATYTSLHCTRHTVNILSVTLIFFDYRDLVGKERQANKYKNVNWIYLAQIF